MAQGRIGRRLLRRPGGGSAADSGNGYGPKPEVVREDTHYGTEVDDAVEEARRQQRRYGVNADYDLVRERFDHYHYLLQNRGQHTDASGDPIRHFLRRGSGALDPEINFSMEKYLKRYPVHAAGEERSPYLEWLKRGRAAGENADPADGIEAWAPLLGLAPEQVLEEVVALREDMVHRLRHGVLGEMFAKAAQVEPLIAETWPETANIAQLPLRGEQVGRAAALIAQCQDDAEWRRARILVVAETRADAAEFVSPLSYIDSSDIVVIVTGRAVEDVDLPAGVRVADFGQRSYGLSTTMQDQALVALVRSFLADAVLNVGSATLHRAMTAYGKALVQSERVIVCLLPESSPALAADPNVNLRSFYDAIDMVEAVVARDEAVRAAMVEHFQLDPPNAARIRLRDELAGLLSAPTEERA